jgi:hypothetical protein
MFPKSVLMFLAPARGATTFHAQIGPKCSGTPCGYQDNSQTLFERGIEVDKHSLVDVSSKQ